MEHQRLSSKNLYHLTNIDAVKAIIKEGFCHHLNEEEIPLDEESHQSNFIVCFNDNKIEDSESLRTIFGNNALILSKEWAIKNGISPVRYIHKTSIGTSKEYTINKSSFRNITQNNIMDGDIMYYELMIHIYSKLFKYDRNQRSIIENSFKNLPDIGKKIIDSMVIEIVKLHNELEHRDSFVRLYEGTFNHKSGKNPCYSFYDEREWRSVKYTNINNDSKCLPNSENLKFSDDDIIAILAEDLQKKEEIIAFINKENDLLISKDKTLQKIMLLSDYPEE